MAEGEKRHLRLDASDATDDLLSGVVRQVEIQEDAVVRDGFQERLGVFGAAQQGALNATAGESFAVMRAPKGLIANL